MTLNADNPIIGNHHAYLIHEITNSGQSASSYYADVECWRNGSFVDRTLYQCSSFSGYFRDIRTVYSDTYKSANTSFYVGLHAYVNRVGYVSYTDAHHY